MSLSKETKTLRKLTKAFSVIVEAIAKQEQLTVGQVKRLTLGKTPERAAKALFDIVVSEREAPDLALSPAGKGTGVVSVVGITFSAMCAHHLLPFHGTAALAYLPRREIVGLSKIPRLVGYCAKGLTLQEDISSRILQIFVEVVDPIACLVRLDATHDCVRCRGVRQEARTVTSFIYPVNKLDPGLKRELYHAIGKT